VADHDRCGHGEEGVQHRLTVSCAAR
jgi:hypothetical protein